MRVMTRAHILDRFNIAFVLSACSLLVGHWVKRMNLPLQLTPLMHSLGFLWLPCCFSVLLWLPFLKQGLTTTLTCSSTPLLSRLLLPFLGRETTDPRCLKSLLPPGSPGKYPGLVP